MQLFSFLKFGSRAQSSKREKKAARKPPPKVSSVAVQNRLKEHLFDRCNEITSLIDTLALQLDTQVSLVQIFEETIKSFNDIALMGQSAFRPMKNALLKIARTKDADCWNTFQAYRKQFVSDLSYVSPNNYTEREALANQFANLIISVASHVKGIPAQYFPDVQDLAFAIPVIKSSREIPHDLQILAKQLMAVRQRTIGKTPSSYLNSEVVAPIEQAYSHGHRFIPGDLQNLEIGRILAQHPDRIPTLSSEQRAKYAYFLFSLQDFHPALDRIESISSRMSHLPAMSLDTLVKLRASFHRDERADKYFDQLIDSLSSLSEEPALQQRIITSIARCDFENLTVLLSSLAEAVTLDKSKTRSELLEKLCGAHLLANQEIALLQQQIFTESLQEYQKKNPDKPIDEVLNDFEHARGLVEIVPKDELALAVTQFREVMAKSAELSTKTIEELTTYAHQIKAGGNLDTTECFALLREVFKREFGVYPFNTQMITALLITQRALNPVSIGNQDPIQEESLSTANLLTKGAYAGVKTGEGKSLIISLVSAFFALNEKRVDIVTSNNYLAERDAWKFKPFYKALGLTVEPFLKPELDTKLSSDTNIFYSTNNTLLIQSLIRGANGELYFDDKRMQVAVVDEVDSLLIDSVGTGARIAFPGEENPLQAEDYQLLNHLANSLKPGDKVPSSQEFKNMLRARGISTALFRISDFELEVYIDSAQQAQAMVRDKDYVVQDGLVVVMDDQNTGRQMQKIQWSYGVHEMVAAREHLELPEYQETLLEYSHHAFFEKFQTCLCLTGTPGSVVEREQMKSLYRLTGFDVPTHRPCIRNDIGMSVVKDNKELIETVFARIDQVIRTEKRAMVVICENVAQSRLLYEAIVAQGLSANTQLLNDVDNFTYNRTPAGEEEIVRNGGNQFTITIATNCAGRGSDFVPVKEVIENGGMYVVVPYIAHNFRVEDQALGRGGRQGAPGTTEIIARLIGDPFLEQSHPWEFDFLDAFFMAAGGNPLLMKRGIDFVRELRNTTDSIQALKGCELERKHDRKIDGYFTAIRELTEELLEARREKRIPNPESAATSLADHMQMLWLPKYHDYDFKKAMTNIRLKRQITDAIKAINNPITSQWLEETKRNFYASAHPTLQKVVEGHLEFINSLDSDTHALAWRVILYHAVAEYQITNSIWSDPWLARIEGLSQNIEAVCDMCAMQSEAVIEGKIPKLRRKVVPKKEVSSNDFQVLNQTRKRAVNQ